MHYSLPYGNFFLMCFICMCVYKYIYIYIYIIYPSITPYILAS